MEKLPQRKKSNGFDPDEQLTEFEAVEYAESRGYRLPLGRLRMSRLTNPRSAGPRFLKVDGYHVRYTRQFIDEFIAACKPCVIDPAERMRKAS